MINRLESFTSDIRVDSLNFFLFLDVASLRPQAIILHDPIGDVLEVVLGLLASHQEYYQRDQNSRTYGDTEWDEGGSVVFSGGVPLEGVGVEVVVEGSVLLLDWSEDTCGEWT